MTIFPERLLTQFRADIALARRSIEAMETGRLSCRERTAETKGESVDVTEREIDRQKRILATLEELLAKQDVSTDV